ncbi:MAG TPA: phosphoribosyltransferase family protein [Nitrososphaeraceae archaeon]|jgi:predicted phosphoribosyltransferase|nr:phosphoribosyltransferase family protein [Nitrososphaeraceae archaeon]
MQAIIYKDRKQAAEHLASELQQEINSRQDVIIVSIPRGGVVIGDIIATVFGIKLDIVVSRKIGAPENPEFAIGAVMPDGNYFLSAVEEFSVSRRYIEQQTKVQIKEINRRLISYRGTADYDREFEDKTVVLVDDGVATGSTLIASAMWIRNNFNCKKLLIAVPVAPAEILNDLVQFADKLVIPYTPDPFIAIGRFYGIFDQVDDNEVKYIMRKHRYKI